MFAVAVDAKRRVHVALEGFLAVDAFLVFVENDGVAFPAGFRLFGHEMWFAHSLDVVHSMAVRADSRIGIKPVFKEGFAVDALQVFLVGRFAVDVELDHHLHVLMADGAGERDVIAVDRGLRI